MESFEEAGAISEDVFEGINRPPVDPETVAKIQARVWELAGRVSDIQDAIFLRYLARDVLSRLPGGHQGPFSEN